jgi:hypothetical protein
VDVYLWPGRRRCQVPPRRPVDSTCCPPGHVGRRIRLRALRPGPLVAFGFMIPVWQ